jgi:phosphoglycerate dehydrogenase-like enzyme
VDLQAARAAGVRVGNIPSEGTGNAAACAEFALFLTLSLLRDAKAMSASLQQRRLGSPTGVVLAGRSALLVGFGAIGRESAARLAALGVRVSALKRTPWMLEGDAQAAALAERGGAEDMHRMLARVGPQRCFLVHSRVPPRAGRG